MTLGGNVVPLGLLQALIFSRSRAGADQSGAGVPLLAQLRLGNIPCSAMMKFKTR